MSNNEKILNNIVEQCKELRLSEAYFAEGSYKSKKVFDERMNRLNNLVRDINEYLNCNNDSNCKMLRALKYRIISSIEIMNVVKELNLVTEE